MEYDAFWDRIKWHDKAMFWLRLWSWNDCKQTYWPKQHSGTGLQLLMGDESQNICTASKASKKEKSHLLFQHSTYVINTDKKAT